MHLRLCVLLFFSVIFNVYASSELCYKIKLPNGRARYRQRGRIAKFMCNTGYILAGEKYSICVKGQWDTQMPKCVRGTCASAKLPANILAYPSHGNGVLNFFCKSNYQLRGSNITYCDGQKWDKPVPTCLASNTTAPLFCDFEQPDICGWNHDLNHDFEWRRWNFDTPSGNIGTGPDFDHTKGKGKDGYYMYIESSSRNENDTARLISPVFESNKTNTCFEFYYHMYGLTTGTLRVYLKRAEDPWNFNPKTAIFTKSKNQGNRWYRAFISLGTITSDYQIVIEGVRGPGYVSDIAIDDVRVIENCDESVEDVTTTSEIYSSSTDTLPVVESCENRCNLIDNNTLNNDVLITCDCDEQCLERSRCCPDYLDFCLATSIDDSTSAVTEESSSSSSTATTSTTKLTTTIKNLINYVTEPKKTDLSNDIDEIPDEKSPEYEEYEPISVPVKEKDDLSMSSLNQKIVVEDNQSGDHVKTIVFIVGLAFGALLASVGMAFVVKRYRLLRCGRLNYSSNGDSQSDVRFLTTDEVLDLNLPKDYDDY